MRFFIADGGALIGTVEKLNPKRARVSSGTDVWVVPYAGLDHVCSSTAEVREVRVTRLKEVAAQARDLMDWHGLDEWALRFNGGQRKLGECRARQKLILFSRAHAVNGAPGQVTDTVVHVVAHALAGPAAGHGPVWEAIAKRLGAIPKSCAPESDEARRTREATEAIFSIGDTVALIARGDIQTGIIVRMNPKRARVQCGHVMWSIPYARLSANRLLDRESPENRSGTVRQDYSGCSPA